MFEVETSSLILESHEPVGRGHRFWINLRQRWLNDSDYDGLGKQEQKEIRLDKCFSPDACQHTSLTELIAEIWRATTFYITFLFTAQSLKIALKLVYVQAYFNVHL